MSEQRAAEAAPIAAELVCAVNDYDPAEVAEILNRPGIDWPALAVVLASYVDPESAIVQGTHEQLTDSEIADRIMHGAATAFGTTVEALQGHNRERHVLDARAVGMAACRLAGLTSPYIGRRFNKDHSTVLYAASKVGEHDRLRRIARRLADPVTPVRGLLGDEETGAWAS